jgi:hypothetical protein
MSLKNIIGSVAIAASIFGLTNCEKKKVVTIKYTQTVNCLSFESDPSKPPGSPGNPTEPADSGKIFMFYKIHSVQNNDKDAEDFNFMLSKIFAGNKEQTPQKLKVWPSFQTAPDTEVIKKGTALAPSWRFVIQVALDPNELKTATQYLSYASVKGGPGVPDDNVLLLNVPEPQKTPKPPEFLDPCYPGGVTKS